MPTISQTRTRWVSQCVIPMHINALSIYKITHSFFFFLVHPCDEAPTHPNTLILHSLTYTSPPPPHTHCHLPSVLASIGVCICLKDLLHRKINGELQSRQQRTEKARQTQPSATRANGYPTSIYSSYTVSLPPYPSLYLLLSSFFTFSISRWNPSAHTVRPRVSTVSTTLNILINC